jgi:hypothetical protein
MKVSAAAAKTTRNFTEQALMIGLDEGDRAIDEQKVRQE